MSYSTIIIIALVYIIMCFVCYKVGYKQGQRDAAKAFQIMLDTVQKSIINPISEAIDDAKDKK